MTRDAVLELAMVWDPDRCLAASTIWPKYHWSRRMPQPFGFAAAQEDRGGSEGVGQRKPSSTVTVAVADGWPMWQAPVGIAIEKQDLNPFDPVLEI